MSLDDPLVRAARGAALLKQGDYREGFPLFDAWRETATENKAPALPFPRWRGQDVAGRRILIWGEHGYGDQIMYARFARLLVERGAEVQWLCSPSLARLFDNSLGITALPSDRPFDLTCDYYCPSSALPLGFDLTPETVPNAAYIAAEPAEVAARVGVATAGSAANPARNLDPALGAALRQAVSGLDLAPSVTGAADFQDTAEIIAGLDLVISIDTATAHLAGAMGKAVWILLPHDADWRWLTNRDDSPWYPSAVLFRQAAPGQWGPVIERVLGRFEARRTMNQT